jgi:hypothetical protein
MGRPRGSAFDDFEPSTPGLPEGAWPLLGFLPWDRVRHDWGLLCQAIHPNGIPRHSGAVCCCCGQTSPRVDRIAERMDAGPSEAFVGELREALEAQVALATTGITSDRDEVTQLRVEVEELAARPAHRPEPDVLAGLRKLCRIAEAAADRKPAGPAKFKPRGAPAAARA